MQTATPPHVISRVVSDSQRGLAVTNLVWAKHPGQNCSGLLAAEIKVASPLRLNARDDKTGSLKNASSPTTTRKSKSWPSRWTFSSSRC